jgi:hypothetical protein
MNLKDFEVFQKPRQGRVASTEPLVSIYKDGTLALNAAAVNLLGADAVKFAYNKKTKQVALLPAERDDPGSYRVRHNKSGGGATVGARAFLDTYNLAASKNRRVNVEKLENALVMAL